MPNTKQHRDNFTMHTCLQNNRPTNENMASRLRQSSCKRMDAEWNDEDDDVVLSDVHLGTTATEGRTRFEFKRRNNPYWQSSNAGQVSVLCRSSSTEEALSVDEEGDLVLPRKPKNASIILSIQHTMATPLSDVGMQVWRGALLMCDYLIHHADQFRGSCVLELGCGVGLVAGILAALGCNVICTDVGTAVLENCRANMINNRQMLQGTVDVRWLDWSDPPSSLTKARDIRKNEVLAQDSSGGFQWTEADSVTFYSQVSWILATDVIYVPEWSEALVRLLRILLQPVADTMPKKFLLALEKRINYTLEDLATTSKAYDHFYAICLGHVDFRAERVEVDFPQYSNYERVKELELWILSLR